MDRWDLFIAGGLASLGVGLWLLHPAACLCTLGLTAVAIGLRGARLTAAREKDKR